MFHRHLSFAGRDPAPFLTFLMKTCGITEHRLAHGSRVESLNTYWQVTALGDCLLSFLVIFNEHCHLYPTSNLYSDCGHLVTLSLFQYARHFTSYQLSIVTGLTELSINNVQHTKNQYAHIP